MEAISIGCQSNYDVIWKLKPTEDDRCRIWLLKNSTTPLNL